MHSPHKNRVVTIAVIIAAVLGGVLGSRASDHDDDSSSSNRKNAVADSNGSNGVIAANAEATVYSIDALSNPVYPTASSIATAAGSKPTVTSNKTLACSNDPFSPDTQDADTFKVRSDHPRLFAPAYKWDCLADQIASDPFVAPYVLRPYNSLAKPFTTDS